MKFEISHEDIIAKVTGELVSCQSFEINIDNHLAALRNAEEEDYAISLAKSIAYNNRMIKTHLERAAAMLELIGFFTEDDDLTTECLRAKVETIRRADAAL